MANDPETRLDRIARDLSRTWLHGSRVIDNAGQTRPATMAVAQQIRVDLPSSGPMSFEFTAAASAATVLISHTDASNSQTFMTDALGKDRARYLTLNVDTTIPNWVFAQQAYSLPNPVPDEDKLAIEVPDPSTPGAKRDLTIVKLPSSALGEVLDNRDNFVSLYQFDSTQKIWNAIPRSNWQPAVMLRFKLKPAPAVPNLPAGIQIFEIAGTPQGDRYYLDRLGLLDAYLFRTSDPNPPDVDAISLAVQQTTIGTPSHLDDWTILRTNLTREARSGTMAANLAIGAAGSGLPYVAVSGADADQDKDAIRLLQMISITNSGGYFLRTSTPLTNADTLVLAVILKSRPDPNSDRNDPESSWLPRASNAVALSWGTTPDSIRFNGLEHIQIAPTVPPGNVAFGWTRAEPSTKTTDEDKFGFGTISLVDYLAIDGTGQQVGRYSQDTVIAIAPSHPLQGDLFERNRTLAIDGALHADHSNTGEVAAMRLLAPHQTRAKLAASSAVADPLVRYFRSTLKCYEDTESPYVRIGDVLRSQITFIPGFRDVFGNRFDAASAPVLRRRLFYTDPLVSPSEWPGIRFATYPGQHGGKPYVFLEMQYRFLDQGQDKKPRVQRLKEIRAQLQGVDGDVSITFTADPIVSGPISLSYTKLANKITTWIDEENANSLSIPEPRIEPLAAIPCDGLIADVVNFDPRLTITRTKPDYGPSTTELPEESLLAQLILKKLSSADSPVMLQAASSQPTSIHELTALRAAGGTSRTNDEFRVVAKAFQDSLGAKMNMQVGFLRDRVNHHQLWFVPEAFFPSAPNAGTYAGWSFATARPLSNRPGSETVDVPDFSGICTTSGPDCWRKHPIVSQTVIDQDFDELGRIAFRFIESESSDLGVMTAKPNADAARVLLFEREQIALTLSSFQGDAGPGYLVSLYEKDDDLEHAGVVRIARDAFLSDLNAFYNVDTILQLPLSAPGSSKVLTFEGTVACTFLAGSTPARPIVSNILLGGGDRKVTLLYDLPPGTIDPTAVQRLDVITGSIHHIQLPLPNGPSAAANLFNQGSWLELVEPQQLKWQAPPAPDFIPVADRRFPSKPVIKSTDTLMPWEDPNTGALTLKPISASNASLLVRWGWKFQFGLIGAGANDIVHVTARYDGPELPNRVSALATTAGWRPQSLLNSLLAIKLLHDNLQSVAEPERLQVAADLATFLREALSPRLARTAFVSAPIEDHFTIPVPKPLDPPTTEPGSDVGGRVIMKGAIAVTWSSGGELQTANVIAIPDATDNCAFLTEPSRVRSYRVMLKLLRNERFGPVTTRPANPSLIYECAPVESPLECWAKNEWPQLTFDNGGRPLQTALRDFFGGLFLQTGLSSMNLEVAASLVWQNGMLMGMTPFSVLPTDIKPAGGTAKDVADFVYEKYHALLGTDIPVDVAPKLRLRVKLATLDRGPTSRTLLDITGIDFSL